MFIAEASTLSVSPGLAAHSNLWEDVNTRQLCGVTLILNKKRHTLVKKRLKWILFKEKKNKVLLFWNLTATWGPRLMG